MYRDEISNLYRGPAIDASYQVSVHSLVSNVPKYIKDHLKENCVNVKFDILSKNDAYLERIVHSKNVRFVYKSLVNAIIYLPTETFSTWEKLLYCEITNW